MCMCMLMELPGKDEHLELYVCVGTAGDEPGQTKRKHFVIWGEKAVGLLGHEKRDEKANEGNDQRIKRTNSRKRADMVHVSFLLFQWQEPLSGHNIRRPVLRHHKP